MTISEAIKQIKYVADANGKKTDVQVPLPVWEALLESWQQMAEKLENEEDLGIFQEWMQQREAGKVVTISLADLEQELIRDGLI